MRVCTVDSTESVCLSVCFSFFLPVFLSVSVCFSFFLSFCLSFFLSFFLCLSVCLSVWLLFFLSFCLVVCLSAFLSVCFSLFSVCLLFFPSVCLPVYLSVITRVFPSVSLLSCDWTMGWWACAPDVQSGDSDRVLALSFARLFPSSPPFKGHVCLSASRLLSYVSPPLVCESVSHGPSPSPRSEVGHRRALLVLCDFL